MRILLLLMLSFAATADVFVKRTADSYFFRFVSDGTEYCWGMPDFVDLSYFNDIWTTVPQTAIDHSWPQPDAAGVTTCNEELPRWKTLAWTANGTSPIYTVQNIPPRMVLIGYAPAGVLCGDAVTDVANRTYQYRQIYYNNMTGIGICTLQ